MITLRITGNAGNQLFQYAFARKLATIYEDEITIDYRYIIKGDGVHKAENVLDFFNTKQYRIDFSGKDHSIQRILYALLVRLLPSPNSSDKKKRFDFLKKYHLFLEKLGVYFYDGDDYISYKYNSKAKNKYVRGYWESTHFFEDIEDELRQELTFKLPPLEENKRLYDVIASTTTICVTVRRYELEENTEEFVSCTCRYFEAGVDFIRKQYPNAAVIVFSDDIKWCRENLNFGDKTYYESGNDPIYEKMRLMSSCSHFVISNSTFSWWVQFLSNDKNKIVVAPDQWRIDSGTPIDIYCDEWVLLNNEGECVKHHK